MESSETNINYTVKILHRKFEIGDPKSAFITKVSEIIT